MPHFPPHSKPWPGPRPIFRPIFFPVYVKPSYARGNNFGVNVQKENQLKGFSFTPDCTGFIVTNPKKAFLWAYNLGLGWEQERGDVYEWLYSFFDPSSTCINYFRQNYQFMSRKDALFYIKLIVSYMRGLLRSEFVDRNFIFNEWYQFRDNMIRKFNFSSREIPFNL